MRWHGHKWTQKKTETFWFFWLQFCQVYDSAYDSAYDFDSDSVTSVNQQLQVVLNLSMKAYMMSKDSINLLLMSKL